VVEYLAFGCSFAFAAAVQPGPLQAFLFSRVAEKGVRATLPASLAPLVSDGPIALVVLLLLKSLPAGMSRILQGAGGVLLLYFAYAAFREWRNWAGARSETGGTAPHTLWQAVAINFLNPNPYLGWSLILGPKALAAWRLSPFYAAALVGGFYATMVLMLALTILLFGTARILGERARRTLLLLSAATLAVLGLISVAGAVA